MIKVCNLLSTRTRVLLIGATLGAIAAVTVAFQGMAADEPFLSVNGTNVSRTQFMDRLEAKYGSDVIEEIINEIVVAQATAQYHVVVPADRINAEVEAVKKQFQSEDEFNKALAKYKLTLDTYKDQVKMRLVLEQLGSPNAPTEDDLKAYYEENKERYDQQDEVNVRHILVKTEEEAKAILDELAKGGDFARIAKERSQDPGSKDNGGEIGYARKGQLVKEFEDVAFALKKDETSGPVKTSYGVHIIRLIDHRLPKASTFNDVRDQIMNDFKEDNTLKPEDVMSDLRTRAVVKTTGEAYKGLENAPPIETK